MIIFLFHITQVPISDISLYVEYPHRFLRGFLVSLQANVRKLSQEMLQYTNGELLEATKG
jgi:hypothetical protein